VKWPAAGLEVRGSIPRSFRLLITWSAVLLRDLEIFLSYTLLGDKLAWYMKPYQWQGL